MAVLLLVSPSSESPEPVLANGRLKKSPEPVLANVFQSRPLLRNLMGTCKKGNRFHTVACHAVALVNKH